MYCSSAPCSTAYRYSRWISPVPANSGSCPLGSVWTWSPISSVVTGAAVPLRVGQVCHAAIAATAVAPAPYRNARRFIDGSSSSSGRLIIASPLTCALHTSAPLVGCRPNRRLNRARDPKTSDAFVGWLEDRRRAWSERKNLTVADGRTLGSARHKGGRRWDGDDDPRDQCRSEERRV